MLIDEILKEMSIAKDGDYRRYYDQLGYQGFDSFEKNHTKIDDIFILSENETYELYKTNNRDSYVLGQKIEDNGVEYFGRIFIITLEKTNILSNLYNNTMLVKGSATNENFQGKTIGSTMYGYLVNDLGFTIVGDRKQYTGSRRLWTSLSKSMRVDIADVRNNKIIEKGVNLFQSKTDEKDFDERLWSYDNSKEHVRPVLTKR